MKKILMIILITILFVYALFVVEECIRLKSGGQHPIIIISGTCDGDKTEHTERKYTTNCKGIGYRIIREYALGGMTGEDNESYKLIKEEFWLFDTFLVWGWIS